MTTNGEPADGGQQLRQEIEQTRERLGQTVEQLVAKADVKTMARTTVAELTGQAKSVVARQRERAVLLARERAVPLMRERAVPLAMGTATAVLIAALLAVRPWKRPASGSRAVTRTRAARPRRG